LGIGVQAVITDRDLAVIGNTRSHPGDELQVVHRLLLGTVLAPTIVDLALFPRNNGTAPGKGQCARDVGDDTFPPWRENGLKKRAIVMAQAVSARKTGKAPASTADSKR